MSLVADAKASLQRALRGAGEGKFRRDVLWNFGSLGALVVSGLALNFVIPGVYGVATLGVFNLVVAAYIFFSQAAVGGIDRSVLRSVSEHADDPRRVSGLVLAAIWPTLLLASLATTAFFYSRHAISAVLESPGVAVGIAWATPGLFCFAINKVLLAVTNGMRRMRAFAVLNALRYLLILGGLIFAIATDMPGEQLGFVFSFAEVILCAVLLVEVGRQLVSPGSLAWLSDSLVHLRFGIKSMASGMLLELNARVDVLMLGVFLDDTMVGIYSFAAMLAEGVFQMLVVLQNNYNPLLAKLIAGKRFDELRELTAKGKRTAFMLMSAVCTVAVLGYPVCVLLVDLIGERPELWQGWLPFGILMAGVALSSGYAPFHHTLLMANQPGWHTALMTSIVACNAGFNLALIPELGIVGAATGTGLAFLSSVVLLRWMVRVRVGVRL